MTGPPDWFDPAQDAMLTPQALRGLVHPVRLRLLDLLQADGPATATSLGQRIGQSSGVTSYHLRVLAEHGFIVEDTERGNGRDRWWRAVHRSTSFTFRAGEDPGSEETIEAAERFIRLVAEESHRRVVAAIATLPARRDQLGTMPWTVSEWPLQLTLAEAEQLKLAVSDLIVRFERSRTGSQPRPDTVRAYGIFQLVPDVT
ncbi:MAG TPA: helix-turn-helix domain-containing protein [Gaiellales bacterium]|nr:helix-turn-helix domain-containing protein [Gaiellales bacterium]HVI38171.1 helix-turn-helix domain-containing protein [Gaiellales bacterium]